MNTKIVFGLIGLSLLLSLSAVLMSSRMLQLTERRTGDSAKKSSLQAVSAGPSSSKEAATFPKATEANMVNATTGRAGMPAMLGATIRLPTAPVVVSKDVLEAEAESEAKRLIELLPDNANALHVLAMLYAQLHKTAEAEELWKRCIELDANSEPYYINLAAIAIDRGENQFAIDTLRQAISRGIESADINHHLGVALNSVGESREAAEVANKTIAKAPNSGAHWFILGRAQQQQGLFSEAELSLKRALELGGNNKALYFALFNVCMRLGKKEEAVEYKSRYDTFKEVELKVEDRYQILSDAEARRICISILSESVALYRALGDLTTCEHLLLRVLALDPENLAACEDLVGIYTERVEPANEIVVRQRIIELNSTNLLNYLLLAKAQAQAGAPQAAEAQIKLAISLSPQAVTGYAAMADFLLEQKQPQRAQWYVEQAIRIKPSSQGFELLARTLSEQGRTADSKAAHEMANQMVKQPQNNSQAEPPKQ